MKVLARLGVLKDRGVYKIAYTYDEYDDKGNMIASNQRGSYIPINEEEKDAIKILEGFVENRMNEN